LKNLLFFHALQAEFLDWLDLHVRDIRKCPDIAFGGIQLIFAGDFLQVLLLSPFYFSNFNH
jgi:hypothetical protein